jgi:hypothetical protein
MNFKLGLALALGASTLCHADFSYKETTKITGGTITRMSRLMPGMGKALEPRTSSVYLKGSRLATVTNETMNIVDLDNETITEVNVNDKTWAVITFAEMRQAMEALARKMSELQQAQPQPPQADLNLKFDVKETGQTRSINGLDTRQFLLTIGMEAGAPQQATPIPVMSEMVSDTWLAKKIPGYDEIGKFHLRMGQKLAWGPGLNPFVMQQRGGGEAMKKLAEESAKLDGTPVYTITRIKGVGGMPSLTGGSGAPQMPNVSDAVGEAARREAEYEAQRQAGRAAGGRLGGIAGGAIGGMMRRRQPQPTSPPQPETSAPAPAQGAATPAESVLMESTQELSGFSSDSVSSSVFDVPTSFTQVEHSMKKAVAQMK